MVQFPSPGGSNRSYGMGARQIYESLREQILRGVYNTGSQLPSSRGLAEELGVSRTTVTAAYEQLAAEGFIDVRQGARHRVASSLIGPELTANPQKQAGPGHLSNYGERLRGARRWPDYLPNRLKIDFRYGDLAPSDFPASVWKRTMNAVMAQRPARLAYDHPCGSRRLRQALQGYLWRARTVRCDPEQIVIVNGSQQGLDLCARLLLDPGDSFVIEDPCYRMAREVFASTGATPVPVEVDEHGMQTEQLAGVAARLAYATPSHQFPLGGVMPIARRHQLLEWARDEGAYVIEDDYDSEYRYDISPVPPLHSLEDHGAVIYLGTISKTLSPMLRIGYLVVPVELQQVFETAKQFADRHSPIAEQESLASLIESGSYENHVRRVRRLNGERREVLLTTMKRSFQDRIAVQGAEAGLHVVIWFNDLPRSRETALVEAARYAGLGLHPISPLYHRQSGAGEADRVGLVVGYSALGIRQIEKGVEMLRDVVAQL
ncbi:MAG: aminotransferase class I/II-fold pyridoxal phosphate-dependent enzyme [Mesorhizobium sp.]|uniref:MocR-like pyridoxine biosynthesis transcription factor PdxR n=1 Tax=unclassified Mesorhizobium TaxID=325217 RepID=UPI000F75F8C0|nr:MULTISPECIES: PLP-dependent aminotransferase family protein [unclassified Mesorhizobium]RVC82516.1 aminotransferase class I/II-fold pyridoxal phosphate-dependent enzyme [Mesorhizobium sp. M2A.F.Ca.ET.046.02.1.1]AZO39308.1 PLP-dependent aminotransferase family protein [Mesorhizobium sp. M2A.F.Ca.ET.046.03.2.1]AZO71546.1 PLP-dependent aminotransferase family protein [Mesorhizobium sp. M1D.F.Ca.ET.043.01.1.1]RWB39376.1 MAG: aminotransferase class I/II-fold pyridoxal phosphate-dependent enzyme [